MCTETISRLDSQRISDCLLMLFSIQFSVFILIVPHFWPLLLFPVALTVHIVYAEYHRRLEEQSAAR